ncbi:MAG: penicillin-binding protein 1C [Cyclobacteriaceae bacterium]
MRVIKTIGLLIVVVIGIVAFTPIPEITNPYSSVIYANDGSIMGARIARDGQWRFPTPDSIPHNLEVCILTFEDQYFKFHPGINPLSVLRATKQNLIAGEIVSGASTITMQVARMTFRAKRTYWQKIKETLLALKLEMIFSKDEILMRYVTMAPYGGNTVGAETAAQRYFQLPIDRLSWAQAALLAVLPNQPAKLYPGKSNDNLLAKRNRLLHKLLISGHIDQMEYRLSVSEPLPDQPKPVPQLATHLLQSLETKHGTDKFQTTIDPYWQQQVARITNRHHYRLHANGIDNLGVLAINLQSGKVLAYIGNTSNDVQGRYVDMIHRPRSSGSILKPMLYTEALDNGLISATTALPDIPTFFAGFTPKNFNLGYDGIVSANEALSKSLNIPFVHLLRDYGFQQFHADLTKLGISTLDSNPNRYGLSLVLGGAEIKLWDIAQVYFSMYRKLSKLPNQTIHSFGSTTHKNEIDLSRESIWHTFNAMTQLVRPGVDHHWESFASSQTIAWKTGTSFGFRDAWAVGMNGEVLVAVWAGNADGEGRAGLIGSSAAGPVLLDVLNLSNHNRNWLVNLKPHMRTWKICQISGKLANQYCPPQDLGGTTAIERIGICQWHKSLTMDQTEKWLVNSSCYPVHKTHQKVHLVLPGTLGTYYQKRHPNYAGLPKYFPDCHSTSLNSVSIIYPTPNSYIYIPKGAQGKEEVILQAAHQDMNSTLYWHLDHKYLGSTDNLHEWAIWLERGKYELTVMDEMGQSANRLIEVISE